MNVSELEPTALNEIARINRLVDGAMHEIGAEGGDVRIFSAGLLSAAIRLHVEIEGPEALVKAMARFAVPYEFDSGAGRA